MLDGSPKKPTKVHNTKDRILGETRTTFGLTIADLAGPDGELRWGLDVRYTSPEDLSVEYAHADDDGEQMMAMNAERLATLGARVIGLLSRSGPDGLTMATIRAVCHVSACDATAVLPEMVRQGIVTRAGCGPGAIYTLATHS
jgi:hypothetical protein